MKNLAKILCAVLALVMMVSCFAACTATENNDPANTDPAKTEDNGGENTGDGVQTFKLGGIGPLTGGAAIYGQAAMNGAKIAVDEINAAGGNIQFTWEAQDDEHDAEKSVNAYNTLLEHGVQAIVGTVTTKPCIAVSAQANEDRVFMLTPSASSTDVIADKDMMFQVCFTDPNQGVASADYIAENFADAKVGVIYKNDDAYSSGIRDTFVPECQAKDVKVVYEGTFNDSTKTDFSVQLKAAKDAGVTVLFLPMYYESASIILKQAKDIDFAPTFFGVDGMDGILTLEGFDTALAEGVYLLTPFSADAEDERTQKFVSTYKELHEDVPNQFAADAYDAVYIIAAALEKAGCTADMSAEDICEALVAVMPQISVDGLTGAGMTWDASGAVAKGPAAVVIKDATYVTPGK